MLYKALSLTCLLALIELFSATAYNLGNVSHQLAMKHGRTWQFDRAMKFYDLSFSSVENIMQDFGFDLILIVILCGLCNNLGYLHARARDMDQMRFCLEWLQRTAYADEFSNASMTEEDYDFFSFYLLFRSVDQFSTATAA